jgi:hypothetical protein
MKYLYGADGLSATPLYRLKEKRVTTMAKIYVVEQENKANVKMFAVD